MTFFAFPIQEKKNEFMFFLVYSKVLHTFLFIVTGQNTITVAVVHSVTEYMWLVQWTVVGQIVVTNKTNKTYSMLELTNPLSVLQPFCLRGLIVKIMPFIYGN